MYRFILVWYTDKDLAEVAAKSLANQVQIMEIDPLRDVMVVLIDGSRPNTSCAGKVCLRPADLAQLAGQ